MSKIVKNISKYLQQFLIFLKIYLDTAGWPAKRFAIP
jgi:hypothetical protein